MKNFAGLQKKEKNTFINDATLYQNGDKKQKSQMITFTCTSEYINVIKDITKIDRVSKSEFIRAATVFFSRASKEERDKVYTEIYRN